MRWLSWFSGREPTPEPATEPASSACPGSPVCRHRFRVAGMDTIGTCHCELCGRVFGLGQAMDAALDQMQPRQDESV
jgi:hypothetical protein